MKRFFLLFVPVIALMLAPLQLSLSAGSSGLVPAVVRAAADPDAPACVKISVKVLNSSGNCVSNDAKNGGAIVTYLRMILQLMTLAIGAVIILMLVVAGIQYITSGGNSGQVASAKGRIVNAITALVLFMLSFAILNFLIPGGLL